MLAVPPALLDILQLRPGAKVGIAVQSGRLVVETQQFGDGFSATGQN
jgi:antitoxin ChpS